MADAEDLDIDLYAGLNEVDVGFEAENVGGDDLLIDTDLYGSLDTPVAQHETETERPSSTTTAHPPAASSPTATTTPQTETQRPRRTDHYLSTEELNKLNPNHTHGLYLGDLTWWTNDADIHSLVLASGLEDTLLSRELTFQEHKLNGKSRGSCYVEFIDPHACARFKDFVSKIEIHGVTPTALYGPPNYPGNPFRQIPKDPKEERLRMQLRAAGVAMTYDPSSLRHNRMAPPNIPTFTTDASKVPGEKDLVGGDWASTPKWDVELDKELELGKARLTGVSPPTYEEIGKMLSSRGIQALMNVIPTLDAIEIVKLNREPPSQLLPRSGSGTWRREGFGRAGSVPKSGPWDHSGYDELHGHEYKSKRDRDRDRYEEDERRVSRRVSDHEQDGRYGERRHQDKDDAGRDTEKRDVTRDDEGDKPYDPTAAYDPTSDFALDIDIQTPQDKEGRDAKRRRSSRSRSRSRSMEYDKSGRSSRNSEHSRSSSSRRHKRDDRSERREYDQEYERSERGDRRDMEDRDEYHRRDYDRGYDRRREEREDHSYVGYDRRREREYDDRNHRRYDDRGFTRGRGRGYHGYRGSSRGRSQSPRRRY